MAGTYKEGVSQELSGVYSLIEAAVETASAGGRGVIAYPFVSNWGPVNTLVPVKLDTEFKNLYNGEATSLSANLVYTLGFAAKPAVVLAYRMATETAAVGTVTVPGATGTAFVLETKYPTDRSFTVAVKDSLLVEGGKVVEILEGSKLLVKAEAATIADIATIIGQSDAINVKTVGDQLPANTAGIAFSGGNNGSDVTVTQYDNFLTAVEADGTANAFAFPGIEDEALLTAAETWTKRVRSEGLYITFARGGGANWDLSLALANVRSRELNNRGILNVGNGADGYTAAELATYVAGRAGSVALNQTLTDEPTPFTAINVITAVTPGERKKAKAAGTIVFIKKGDAVLIDEGVNTLTVPGEGEKAEMGKIRVSNALDYITGQTEIFGEAYKRDKSNTPEARETYAAAIENEFLRPLAAMEVLQPGYFYRPDPEYHGSNAIYTAKIDEAFFYSDITPVDSMEKIYQKFGVSF